MYYKKTHTIYSDKNNIMQYILPYDTDLVLNIFTVI